MPKTIELSAAQFKATCLKLMDQAEREHQEVVITKRGRPVARLVPYKPSPKKDIFGAMAGTVVYEGDIMSPIDVEWEAQSG